MSKQPDLSHHIATVNGLRLHYVIAGRGDPVVLLHGWPQTWREWRHLIPLLASKYTVIAPDMRGFGDSDKPSGGYDKRTVAKDIRELVRHLGFKEIYLVGHDLGMMVAYQYAASNRVDVRGLAVLEAGLPGLGLEAFQDTSKFPHLWHFGFFNAPGVAEALIAGREKMFLSHFVRHLAYNTYAVTDDDLNEYADRMSAPGALRASFEYYRAFPTDALDNQESARRKLSMPVLGIGGDHSLGEQVGIYMRPLAENARGATIKHSGHWIPEEQPEQLAELLLAFFEDPLVKA